MRPLQERFNQWKRAINCQVLYGAGISKERGDKILCFFFSYLLFHDTVVIICCEICILKSWEGSEYFAKWLKRMYSGTLCFRMVVKEIK